MARQRAERGVLENLVDYIGVLIFLPLFLYCLWAGRRSATIKKEQQDG